MLVEINQMFCKRCGWKWTPRKPEVRICPHCKTAYFDTGRETKKRKAAL